MAHRLCMGQLWRGGCADWAVIAHEVCSGLARGSRREGTVSGPRSNLGTRYGCVVNHIDEFVGGVGLIGPRLSAGAAAEESIARHTGGGEIAAIASGPSGGSHIP